MLQMRKRMRKSGVIQNTAPLDFRVSFICFRDATGNGQPKLCEHRPPLLGLSRIFTSVTRFLLKDSFHNICSIASCTSAHSQPRWYTSESQDRIQYVSR